MSKQQTARNTQQADDDSSYAHLPKVYYYQTPNGSEPIEDPVYRCLADGFYGVRRGASYFQEGEVIALAGVPNQHLLPLNRAAGKAMHDWLATLPTAGVQIGVSDLMEAATMLRPKEGDQELSTEDWGKAVQALAVKLKAKREGRTDLYVPPIGQVVDIKRDKLPGLLGAHYTDPERRSPGEVGIRPVLHEPQAAEQVRAMRPAMTGTPAPAPQTAG